MAWQAGRGKAWPGGVRLGTAGKARQGAAWQGVVGRGRQGGVC